MITFTTARNREEQSYVTEDERDCRIFRQVLSQPFAPSGAMVPKHSAMILQCDRGRTGRTGVGYVGKFGGFMESIAMH